MTPSPRAPANESRAPEISVSTILWLGVSAVFVLLRVSFAVNAPVGGFELIHLAGAWQASIGETDTRFVPTLFQAIAALSFQLTSSETPARGIALLATSTVPLGLYLLRDRLGDAGALLTLTFFALDGPGIVVGASASAFGLDTAITVWLAVALLHGPLPAWMWGCLAFLVAGAGPLVLPLALAAGATSLANRRYPRPPALVAGLGGASAAVILSSFSFGLGWHGLTVPPFVLFAAGYDEAWSGPSTLKLALLYSLPLLALGLAGAGVVSFRAYRANSASSETMLMLVWPLVALGWFVTSGGSRNPVAVAGLTLPLAFLSGPLVAEACVAAWRADWRTARYLVPAALAALMLAMSFVLDWARLGKAGDANEQLLVVGFVLLALSCLGYVAATRAALPAVMTVAAAVLVVPLFAGAFGTSFGSSNEPLPSPPSPSQLRDLRAIALEVAASGGGNIAVHPTFERDITWAFRDSGTLIVASRVPETADVVLWPSGASRPEGYAPLAGDWNVSFDPPVPSGDLLDYLRWFMNRNVLAAKPLPIAVYVKGAQ